MVRSLERRANKMAVILSLVLVTGLALGLHLLLIETDWRRMGSPREILSLVANFIPDLTFVPHILKPLLDTFLIAFWGTALALFMSVPVAIMAARNLAPLAFLCYPLGRAIIVISRSGHEIIFALLFISALGLGALPGILALAFRSIGFMGKTTAEAIENMDHGAIDALKSAGAGRLSVLLYGVLPQILPLYVGNAIFQLDINLRRAAILGLVGAGGIGIQFSEQMLAYEFDRAGTIVLGVVCMVVLGEIASNRLRERLLRGAK